MMCSRWPKLKLGPWRLGPCGCGVTCLSIPDVCWTYDLPATLLDAWSCSFLRITCSSLRLTGCLEHNAKNMGWPLQLQHLAGFPSPYSFGQSMRSGLLHRTHIDKELYIRIAHARIVGSGNIGWFLQIFLDFTETPKSLDVGQPKYAVSFWGTISCYHDHIIVLVSVILKCCYLLVRYLLVFEVFFDVFQW